jgi:hypothetical protein
MLIPYKCIIDLPENTKPITLHNLRKHKENPGETHMSRTASITRQATEAAPPALLRVERRPCFGKRLETIDEESDGGRSQSCNLKPPAVGSSGKDDFPKRNSSMVAT